MPVYVDTPIYRLGRMHMCHMVADTSAELLAMAAAIGMRAEWVQNVGQHNEHFDVCKAKRAEAVRLGAGEISSRELGRKLIAKRAAAAGRR